MNITILGTGRWAGFHIWYQATILKNDVLVWGRDDEFYRELSTTRKNRFLELPQSVNFTTDLSEAIKFADYIVVSISAQAMPGFSKEIALVKPMNKTFVLAMKGIIDCTGERLSEVISREIDENNNVCVWVGPGHPSEFLAGQPNFMIIDGCKSEVIKDVAGKFKSKLIRLYEGGDLLGVEIGAAAKNVIGIAAGILDGANASSLKGALMARGCLEVSRLIVAMGGKQLTAYGISHLGDFEATLFSPHSNNRMYGEKLYKGEKMEYLAEGVATSKALNLLATKYKVEMPICRLVYQITHEGKDFMKGFDELFERGNAKEFCF